MPWWIVDGVEKISIHAPTRGATQTGTEAMKRDIFQSTLLQEERLSCVCIDSGGHNFNPRSYKRSDRSVYRLRNHTAYFNPRSYKRSDYQQPKHTISYDISIHAPTRGATLPLLPACYIFLISIHAPTRGATFIRVILEE